MIDVGIVMLINNGLSSPPFVGGYLEQAPKNEGYPNYTYRVISDVPNNGLLFARGLAMRRLEIDVKGSQDAQGADAIIMAKQIDLILDGFSGILPDPDQTFVSSCFRSDIIDHFDTAFRTYRRVLEYEINYAQS